MITATGLTKTYGDFVAVDVRSRPLLRGNDNRRAVFHNPPTNCIVLALVSSNTAKDG